MSLNYYLDEDSKIVDPNLFTQRANEVVESFIENGRARVSKHQARKFYNQVLLIQEKIDLANDPEVAFKRQLPFLRMLISKAYYARERKKVNQSFYKFIETNAGQISDLEEFRIFVHYFETVIAYCERLRG